MSYPENFVSSLKDGGNYIRRTGLENFFPFMKSSSRRHFLQSLGLITGAFALGSTPAMAAAKSSSPADNSETLPARSSGAIYMGDFCAPKLDRVKIAFIGLSRGFTHLASSCAIEGVDIVGVCDLHQDLVDRSVKHVRDKTGKVPAGYSKGPEDYLRMLRECKPDAVVISTDWASHVPLACNCMKNGAHSFIEVPLSPSMKELWTLIDTSETTRKHCMMLENVNYGRDELMFLNIVRLGLIGELLHGEAAYIHNLRDQLLQTDRGEGSWRTAYMEQINGNLYPTHGLGPVAQYMNLARGEDTFDSLVSLSSPALGRAAFARTHLPDDHKWNAGHFICGDMNNTIIKTGLGRTVLVQWDETTPRPYSRLNLIQGTAGTLAGFPTRVAGEKLGKGNYHEWIEGKDIDSIYEQYDHPLWKRIGDQAKKMGGHGGMDFVMMYRIIESLRQGTPMDQNVYEGAFWSSVVPLSAQSVANGGMPVRFPDFTRGSWKTTKPLSIIS